MLFSKIALLSLLGLVIASPVAVPAPEPLDLTPISSPSLASREESLASGEEALSKGENLTNFLAILLDLLPAISGTIDAVTGILTTFEGLLAKLTGEQTTYNELSGTCKPYTVIFARGTTEPGNVGILVGPPFFKALDIVAGEANVVVQGVNGYDADVDGYLDGGDAGGSAQMAAQITAAKAKCPNTKLIASGYSQGGQLVHNAAKLLPAATAQWISKVVIFGDPFSAQPVTNVAASKTKIFCNQGDNICVNGALILPAHLIYGTNAAAAAAFVVS